ncbi:hypothetical protein LC048_03270 [Mesobacillus subterraneus]|uniref:hypothetical protein n=1 Tax=Mesobacillus subterraneus TaxID=285983 RepID=UPI001CFD58A5|nr:hypothetical protein [Mesobacillus subterraneus]WLR56003.1 hypothetical protein LC048_03270 [Mesobacillus subterraneus]
MKSFFDFIGRTELEKAEATAQLRKALEGLTVKSFFDFIGRTELEKYSRLSRNTETGDSDKEALLASAGKVEVSEFLGGDTRLASRGVRSRS